MYTKEIKKERRKKLNQMNCSLTEQMWKKKNLKKLFCGGKKNDKCLQNLDGNRVVVCFGFQFLFLLDLIVTLFIRPVHTIHKYPCKQTYKHNPLRKQNESQVLAKTPI